jgi:hypothetical protein
MSTWALVKTQVKDLETFLRVCDNHGIKISSHSKDRYNLNMKDGSGLATLTQQDNGSWALSYDQDPKYSMFSETYGREGGVLMRDYATEVAKNQAFNMGMSLISEDVREDGSIRLILGVAS